MISSSLTLPWKRVCCKMSLVPFGVGTGGVGSLVTLPLGRLPHHHVRDVATLGMSQLQTEGPAPLLSMAANCVWGGGRHRDRQLLWVKTEVPFSWAIHSSTGFHNGRRGRNTWRIDFSLILAQSG